MASKLIIVVALALGCFALAQAQIPTGQNNVCCAFIWNSANRWQLVCNNPTNVSLRAAYWPWMRSSQSFGQLAAAALERHSPHHQQ
jgi:hypothetical protein